MRITIFFTMAVCTSLAQEAIPSANAESPNGSVQSNRSLSDEFVDLIFKKYTSLNPSWLSPTEFARLWTSLMVTQNGSHLATPIIPSNCVEEHGAKKSFCKATKECTNSKQLFEMATKNGKTYFDGVTLKEICPVMLYQLDSGLCSETGIDLEGRPEVKVVDVKKKPSSTEVWLYGIGFVTIISACSLVGVSLLPLMGKAFYSKMLTVMIGLAVGSLSGSSLFHLIPQAFGLPDTDPEHNYLPISLLLWFGVWLFFMIERFLKIMMDTKQRKNQQKRTVQPNHWPLVEHNHERSSSSQRSQATLVTANEKFRQRLGEQHPELCAGTEIDKIYESQEQVIKASFGHQVKPQRSHSHEQIIYFKSDSPIQTVAWMIIFGDGFHNFIDGLSLGAAFNESITTGISISIAVLCEELPHELGDFAVLLSAGMTMRQALLYNFLSACTCYLGLALGIVLGEFEASSYIFAVAGGMFLYISLVDMVPEMNEVAEEASAVSVCEALKILTLQNVGVIFGLGALYVLAKFQDQIRLG